MYELNLNVRHGRVGAQHRSAVTAALPGTYLVEFEKVNCTDRLCVVHHQDFRIAVDGRLRRHDGGKGNDPLRDNVAVFVAPVLSFAFNK